MSIAVALAWTGVVFLLLVVFLVAASDAAATRLGERAAAIGAGVSALVSLALFIAAIWMEALT